jgi:hypothetical protein
MLLLKRVYNTDKYLNELYFLECNAIFSFEIQRKRQKPCRRRNQGREQRETASCFSETSIWPHGITTSNPTWYAWQAMLLSATRRVAKHENGLSVGPVALTKPSSVGCQDICLPTVGNPASVPPLTWREAARHWQGARPLGPVRYQGRFYSVCKQSCRYTDRFSPVIYGRWSLRDVVKL